MKIATRHTKTLAGLLIALGLMLGAFTLTTVACSCAPNPEPLVALDQADAVFAGRVVALELVTIHDADPTVSFALEYLKVSIAVHSRWKGEPLDEAATYDDVYTAFTCCICGFHFAIGEEYLIYASADEDGTLQVSACSRTTLLSAASEDLVALGDLKPQSLDDEPCEGGIISP